VSRASLITMASKIKVETIRISMLKWSSRLARFAMG
jgi:hypothetical protein